MKTALCSLLDVELPIVQAPMGGATTPELAAAVSNAGALGTLALSWHPPDAVRAAIRATRALTAQPFAVNLVLAFPQAERLRICLEEAVPVISFFWGDAAPHLNAVRQAGAKSLLTVASAEQARRAVDAGVDAVVAQGWEAGGHVLGEVATLPLVRAVVDEVSPTPVIAAGGVSDGRGLAAALALGAAGVWIGTRFLGASEAAIHPEYRRRLIEAAESATVHTRLFDVGWRDAPHRVLRNSTYEAWDRAGRPESGRRPGEGEILARGEFGETPRYASTTPGPATAGDIEALSLWSGQGVAQLRREQPAADIVREIAGEARAVLKSLAELEI
jgi:NAD(P)H-dependent flavin oxidoreductase YrpB (nitropropane dioxygenase family)